VKTQLENQQHTGVKKNPVQDETTRLAARVLEVAEMFPTIHAVCYKLEGNTFYVDFYAPKMAAEEHFEFVKTMTEVEDAQAFVQVEFHATDLALEDYRTAGFTVVVLDGDGERN